MSKDKVMNEIEMDRGVTIDPRDFEVTDELIAKIEKRERMKEILQNDVFTEKEKFDKINKSGYTIRSFGELRRLTHLLK